MFLLGFKRDNRLFTEDCVRIARFARQSRDNTFLDYILLSPRSMTRLVQDVSATSGYLTTVSCYIPVRTARSGKLRRYITQNFSAVS
jgi:hypothetical protein